MSTIAACVVLLAVALAYVNLESGLPGSFLIDDVTRITNMSIVNLTPEMLALAIESADSGHLGRPVSLASLYITKYLNGDNPAAFKHENILLHLITGLLLFWLTYRVILALNRNDSRSDQRHAAVIAACVSVFWLIHPLHVSTVLYAVQRMTILSSLFTACALLTYVVARDGPLWSTRSLVLFFCLFPAFTLLALFSKEDAALIPLYVFLLEALIFRFRTDGARDRAVHRAVLGLFVVIPLVLGGLYFAVHLDSFLHDYVMRRFSLSDRIGSEAVIMWRYTGMILLPRLSDMALFHDAAPIYSLTSMPVLVSIIAWIGVLVLLVRFHRRAPLMVYGIAFFLTAHLIESTFIPLELMFEHRNYLASVGLLLATVEGIRKVTGLVNLRTSIVGLLVVAFVAQFAFLQNTRANVWSDRRVLIPTMALDHPKSARATSALANLYETHGKDDKAQAVLDAAMENTDPYYHLSIRLHQLGISCRQGEDFPDALYSDVRRRIKTEPLMAYALSGLHVLGEVVMKDICPPLDADDVITLVQIALDNPHTRRRTRFNLHSQLAELHAYKGDLAAAASHYEAALRSADSVSRPSIMRASISLTDLYIELEEWEKARSTLDRNLDMMSSGDLSLLGAGGLIRKQMRAIPDRNVE